MERVRCCLAVLLAYLVQRCLLVQVEVLGVVPLLLPPLLCLLGMAPGPDRGAGCGLFGGLLCLLAGCSPWILALYPLIGGISGAAFHNSQGFWGTWLRTVPVLAGMEVLLVLGHWMAGNRFPAALAVAWPELLLALACYPLAAGIGKAASLGRTRRV